MTPQTFITKWGPGGPAFALNEEQGAQSQRLLAPDSERSGKDQIADTKK